ncbi:MAG: hypothetical protein ACTSVG_08770 [Alphaproteobacteria bacterium]
MTRTILTNLAPLGLTALLLSSCAGEPGAPAATQGSNTNLYADGPVWQGNICMARTRDGKQVRVSPSNCPPKPAE